LRSARRNRDYSLAYRHTPGFLVRAYGAGEGIRTPDPLITNQMLYQLSYASKILPAARHKL
jgi:hypothetical protein